jgi:hypothetical protein
MPSTTLLVGSLRRTGGRVAADGPMRRHEAERATLQGIHCRSVRVLLGQRDPADGERHRRMASKVARSKANRELAHLKAQPQELTRDVLTGEVKTARWPWPTPQHAASGCGVQHTLRETTDELEERLQSLERTLEGAGGEAGRVSWGV